MTLTLRLVAVSLLALGPACASAQTSGPRTFRALTSSVNQAEATQTREVRIEWTTSPAPGGTPSLQAASAFRVMSQRRSPGALRRERRPELSTDRLVIVLRDAAGTELDWRVVPDPQIIRAEVPGPDGQLSGRVLMQDSTELLLELPDVPGADRLQIYRPLWNGKEFTLDPLAQVYIGDAR